MDRGAGLRIALDDGAWSPPSSPLVILVFFGIGYLFGRLFL